MTPARLVEILQDPRFYQWVAGRPWPKDQQYPLSHLVWAWAASLAEPIAKDDPLMELLRSMEHYYTQEGVSLRTQVLEQELKEMRETLERGPLHLLFNFGANSSKIGVEL